jgi:hypothetical protein
VSVGLHNKGDLVRVTGVFKDINGTLVDPTTVTLKVMDPSGNIDTYTYAASPNEIIRLSIGTFYRDVNADESGEWRLEWQSTGDAQGSQLTQFVVEPTPF